MSSPLRQLIRLIDWMMALLEEFDEAFRTEINCAI